MGHLVKERMTKKINREFWRGKRVLVTGHTGFKGAWLCLVLSSLDCTICGVALPPDEQSLYIQADVNNIVHETHYADLADAAALEAIVAGFSPDIIVHLAAQSLVRASYREPHRTFATNVMGAVHLFEAVRKVEAVQAVLTATTDKVYLNLESGKPFREGDRLGGKEPYSASKACAEIVVAAYRRSYLTEAGVAMPVARAGNVIGGGDWAVDRLIPDAVRAAISQKSMCLRNPNSVRPWQFVLDVLAGYLLLIEHSIDNCDPIDDPDVAAWNFGPSVSGSVTTAQICRWIGEWWPGFRWNVAEQAEDISESNILRLDSSKASTILGWTAAHDGESAVHQSLRWYSSYASGMSAKALCQAQIAEHPALL